MKAIERYSDLLSKHGDSIRSLGWQEEGDKVRKGVILSGFDFKGKSILDIGCGYGDLNAYLKGIDYSYTGIDVVPEMINLAKEKYDREFVNIDFSLFEPNKKYDIIIASGIFNVFEGGYALISKYMKKALDMCNEGICFNFLSNKVDWELENHFHSDPATILDMAYRYSRNIVFRNDYMPFEFVIFIYKENNFDERRVFVNYESRNITK